MSALLALLAVTATPACTPPPAHRTVLLAVATAEPQLEALAPLVQSRLRTAVAARVQLLPPEATARALGTEGGARAREEAVLAARLRLETARARFRDLDDEAALAEVAALTTGLVAVHQAPGAVPLLARAHLLAAAIYLARGERDATRARLHRVLDLDADLDVSPERYDPRLLDLLAATRRSRGARARGRLSIETPSLPAGAAVFLDGRPLGTAPLTAEGLPEGRHLLRVSAPGRRSLLTSVRIRGDETTRRPVHLGPDPDWMTLPAIAADLRAGLDPRPTLQRLADNGEAGEAWVAEILLAPARAAATATAAVRLWSSSGGQGWAASLSPSALAEAVADVRACRQAPWPERRAPALPGPAPLVVAASPVPTPEPVWRRPWLWALVAGVALGAAGALVAWRADSGPPDTLSITLVPRP